MTPAQCPRSPSALPSHRHGGRDGVPTRCGGADDYNIDYAGCRRSSRPSKRPSFFKVVHETRADREVMAAIKRSKLEKQHMNLDYGSLVEVPTVYATEAEFRDPVTLWSKYSHLGEKFGAVKVVPPSGWRGVCPLDTGRLKFKIREQQLHKLSSGKVTPVFAKRSPYSQGFSHPAYEWDCAQMQGADSALKLKLFGRDTVSNEEVERMYWRIVKSGTTSLAVTYGADLNVYSSEFEKYLVDVSGTEHESDVWNLRNLPKCPGSLLRYLDQVIPGVNSPWLYIGMAMTSFCWHTEDNYFGAVNYHHWGAPKIWYVIPPRKAGRLEAFLRNYVASEGEDFAVYSLKVQVPPDVLIANGIPVCRIVQRENEFVLAWPRAFHSGMNVGYNCNEACNIVTTSWIPMGYQSLLNYKYNRSTCVPFYTLVMGGVGNYREYVAEDLSHMINALTILLLQEMNERTVGEYRRVQMYLHLAESDAFDVQSFMDKLCPLGFNAKGFVSAFQLMCSKDDDEFLRGCTLLSSAWMKDCDLCDTPTFASCLICLHCNCTVCVTCQSFHPCECKTRMVLYRYPLLAFHRMISILKGAYRSMSGAIWRPKSAHITLPTIASLAALDKGAFFSIVGLLKAQKSRPKAIAAKRPRKSASDKSTSWSDIDCLSTTDDCLSYSSSSDSSIPAVGWESSWFDDLRGAVDRWQENAGVTPPAGASRYGEIALKEPYSLSDDTFARYDDVRVLATVTKVTARYLMLSFEENCAYVAEGVSA
ncbi:histone lysine demethylase JMJC1/KDM5D/JARID1D [Babesia caballi]|uniref:Histone lysine demethylase JMJC1/KDM5D/JARID1D n=1 Tax=Babesia caballi TaxID=5871 RepID=A0AAV4M1W0_BABCB|nr:histone lysine demethylase JMJC1/KDM5D/JARID1D [Babesia caballi]